MHQYTFDFEKFADAAHQGHFHGPNHFNPATKIKPGVRVIRERGMFQVYEYIDNLNTQLLFIMHERKDCSDSPETWWGNISEQELKDCVRDARTIYTTQRNWGKYYADVLQAHIPEFLRLVCTSSEAEN